MNLRFKTAVTAAIFVLLVFFSGEKKVYSQEFTNNSFITIVNPVRISAYTKNSSKSIESEYFQVNRRDLPATWLLSFDVINDKKVAQTIKKFDNKQELGLLFEVSPNLARASDVIYNQTDSWHRSSSLFLNGYRQEDRIKLIDHLFGAFKKEFGYFPKSVGAWWIDAFSLDYMSKKYGLISNLNVADQAGTDGYSVWGTYWSSPYYPSKINAAFPANTKENKLDVVTLRWASRDPLNGYKSPDKRESTRFSTQDYFTIGLGHEYFENLLRLYTSREFGQITIGLEGDFPPEVYSGNFSTHLSIAQRLEANKEVKFSTMSDFANAYRNKYKDLSPGVLIESNDLLESSKKVFWFQNPNYRIGLIYDFNSRLIDLKTNSNLKITLDTGYLITSDKDSITFEKGEINFGRKEIEIKNIPFKIDQRLLKAGLLKVTGNKIIPSEEFVIPKEGLVFTEIKPKIPYAVKSRIYPMDINLIIVLGIFLSLILFTFAIKKNRKIAVTIIVFAVAGSFIYLILIINKPLYVSQSEIDALFILKNLGSGKVLLYDKDCLRCRWNSKDKPAAMEGRKDYVREISKKPIVYSLDFVLAKNPEQAKNILKKTKTKYIYLTKYEDYIEAIAFNPKDLKIRKIFENANAAIFEVY
ncbi:MAG: hypothetical protein US51_C0053G0003 [Microgenomates group bacterium GW2011_GWA2_37_6]|nr:MAG: hypothetical protein US51_C0053G0003 [Microgenomates group bacterium GW2011_GWA2_37_6]